MKALVTGSHGFLGRHFRKRLLEEGYSVVSLDVAHPDRPIDCRDFFRTNKAQFDLVIHCAALVGGRQGIDGSPLTLGAYNLSLDGEMFHWAARTQPGRVVYLSSSAAYPVDLQRRPGHTLAENDIDLDLPALPDQTYGWTKLTGELLAERLRQAGVPVTVVRPFSGYGEDQAITYPFRAFIEKARARKTPFPIWGSADQARDWVHVDDVVAAVLTLVEYGMDGPMNIANGVPVTMRELAIRCCVAAGYSPTIEIEPDAPMGVLWRVGSSRRLTEVYKPAIGLDEGVERAMWRNP